MVDVEMLQAITELIRASEQRMTENTAEMIRASESRMTEMIRASENKMMEKTEALNKQMLQMQDSITELRLTLENVTNRNINIIAEGHFDLLRKLDEAVKIGNNNEMLHIRVNVLEEEVRRLKSHIA